MKTLQEVYNSSLDQINTQSCINDIVKEIQLVTTALQNKEISKWTGDELSRALTKVAILRVNLGIEMADAIAYYDFSYLHRKITYASEWKPTKQRLNETLNKATVQDIDSDIQQRIEEKSTEELKNKHYAERLRIVYDATETLISSLQTRLSVLKSERLESKYQ
jgi:hypothetical protein